MFIELTDPPARPAGPMFHTDVLLAVPNGKLKGAHGAPLGLIDVAPAQDEARGVFHDGRQPDVTLQCAYVRWTRLDQRALTGYLHRASVLSPAPVRVECRACLL